MNMHSGTPITIHKVAEICGNAYPLAFSPVNIQVWFRGTGIWPLNQNIFQNFEFLSSTVMDRPEPTQCIIKTTQTCQRPSTSVQVRRWVDPRATVRLEGLGKLKKSDDLIGNWTHSLLNCSIVPQPAMLPHAPIGPHFLDLSTSWRWVVSFTPLI
jgi:hypothetical protein